MDGIPELVQTANGADVQSAEVQAAKNFTATHPGGPSTATSLGELRWEGMTNTQLAGAVQELNNGNGAAAMTEAADALANVAADLTQINDTLQTQLQAIGVNWQSQTASDLADQMLGASAAYGGTVTDQGGQGSTAINQQAEAYATARNAAPQPQALTSNTQPSNGSLAAGGSPFTGHGNDHAQQVSQANAARNQAIDAMNNYTSSSQSNLGGYHPPSPPPAIGLTPQPSGGTSTSGYPGAPVVGGVGTLPPGVPGGSGGVSPVGVPGTPGGSGSIPLGGVPGAPASGVGLPGSGGFPSSGSVPGGGFPGSFPGGGVPGVGVPGGGGSAVPPGTTPIGPGPVTGIGPTGGGGVPSSRAAGMSVPAAGIGGDIGEIAAGAAVAGGTAAVGIVGANTKKGGEDEEFTGRKDNEPGGFADDDDDFNPNRSVLAELDADEAAAARMNAELSASEPVAPGLMEPALGRRDDDAEHRSGFAVTDDEFFDDGRMVIPDVLGGNPPGGRADDDEQDA